jgi:hypothetical protein
VIVADKKGKKMPEVISAGTVEIISSQAPSTHTAHWLVLTPPASDTVIWMFATQSY